MDPIQIQTPPTKLFSENSEKKKVVSATNVYLDARREWNERYGDYISQARAWRIVAIVALSVAVIAVLGVAYIGSRNRFVPYVVEVDKLGAAVAVRQADQARPVDERVIRSKLARWITAVRGVVADVAAERALIREAYATVNKAGPAYTTLNEHFRKRSPFKRAETETVDVEVRSILAISKDTWRVEWDETVRARNGSASSTEPWQATITVVVNPPSDESILILNPMGIYADAFNWQKRL
jgi:type IV secretion system protein TrbF